MKKKILILVEGKLDKHLFSLLNFLFIDENILEIIAYNGDKLTEYNYYSYLFEEINILLNKEKTYELKDFFKIYEISDTDGCFIKDDNILLNPTISRIYYSDEEITAKDKKALIFRNKIKKENINKILKMKKIKLFFSSRNLEHAYFNKENLTTNEKDKLILTGYNYFKNHLGDFIRLLFYSNYSNTYNYLKSWDYIKLDTNSLKRNSNLALFLLDNLKYLKKEYIKIINEFINL